jgi:ribosomal protein S18 acetylase RimI-like enzyme
MAGRVPDGPRLSGLAGARASSVPDDAGAEDASVAASIGLSAALDVAEVADGEVDAVVALWRGGGLAGPGDDPYRDVADARLGATSTVLVGRARSGLVPDGAPAGAPRPGEVVAAAAVGGVRGVGLGREMVVAAEAWLAAAGARTVRVTVGSTDGAALGFYAGLGYAAQERTVLGRRLDDA